MLPLAIWRMSYSITLCRIYVCQYVSTSQRHRLQQRFRQASLLCVLPVVASFLLVFWRMSYGTPPCRIRDWQYASTFRRYQPRQPF
eukprot:323648-Pleurochrysis_carterae.AAC.1